MAVAQTNIRSAGTIMRDVRVAMDMNARSKALLDQSDIDTLTLDDLIVSKILPGAKRIQQLAPSWKITCGVQSQNNSIVWENDRSNSIGGTILLPEACMRVLSFQMNDWVRPVQSFITPQDAAYSMQFSRYGGIRGNWEKPIVAIRIGANSRQLEFFSCKTKTATVKEFVYLPYPVIDSEGGVSHISDECYDAIIYEIAALTYEALKEADMAQMFFTRARECAAQ